MLGKLRAARILVRFEAGRLIVEAPVGVVTAEIRAELVRHKAELMSSLAVDSGHRTGQEPIATEAIREVASLLAVAYRRHVKVQRAPVDEPTESVNRELAFSTRQSVHECDRTS